MRRAVTLVELIVVIALIAILASILLPALERGGKQAMRLKCLGRTHQIGIAMTMYRSSSRDRWPWARRSVHPEHPEWPDPTASLADLYPQYAPKAYLFECPVTADLVEFNKGGTDFLNCRNFDVAPKSISPEGKRPPSPPSYFYDGGWPGGVSIGSRAHPGRVVYGDECLHGVWEDPDGRLYWMGENNHPGGGNFLFVDGRVEWLPLRWWGRPNSKEYGRPAVLNPQVLVNGSEGPYHAYADTNVFTSSRRHPDKQDADLAGMMWIDGGWKEF